MLCYDFLDALCETTKKIIIYLSINLF